MTELTFKMADTRNGNASWDGYIVNCKAFTTSSIQFISTGTLAGTVKLQVSNDYNNGRFIENMSANEVNSVLVNNVVNWFDVPLLQ